jgi:hypothetical protein
MRLKLLLVCLCASIALAAVGPMVGNVSAQGLEVSDAKSVPPAGGPSRAPAPGTNPRWTLWSFMNKQNRQTIRSVQVTLKQPDGATQTLAMTDGQWLAVVAAGRYQVTASADGFQTTSGLFDTTSWTSNHALTVTFDPNPPAERAALVVVALDQGTNLPINGATVSITGPGGTRTATVGPPQSTAVLLNLPSGAYKVTVSMPGYDTTTAEAQVTSPQQSSTTVRLKRAGGQTTLRVKAQTNAGIPIGGATVVVTSPGFRTTGTTGADGIASMAVSGETVTIDLSASGYASVSMPGFKVGSASMPTFVLQFNVPLPPKPTPMRIMGNLIGSTEKDATVWLDNVGLKWTVKYVSAPQQDWGRVTAQSVPAGRSTAGPVALTVGQK